MGRFSQKLKLNGMRQSQGESARKTVELMSPELAGMWLAATPEDAIHPVVLMIGFRFVVGAVTEIRALFAGATTAYGRDRNDEAGAVARKLVAHPAHLGMALLEALEAGWL
jgi:hypothetical protein